MPIPSWLVLATGLTSPLAWAQSPDSGPSPHVEADTEAQAVAAYEEGTRAYNAREYDRAVQAFEKSYGLAKEPILLFNIGQSYRLMGSCERALDYYQRYRNELGEQEPVGGYAQAVGKCEEALSRTPRGTVADLNADPEASTSRGRATRTAGLAVGGAGVVVLGAGVFFFVRASSLKRDIERHEGMWTPDVIGKIDAQNRDRVLGPVLVGVGAAAMAGGAALYFYFGRTRGRESAPLVTFTQGGALVGWSSAF